MTPTLHARLEALPGWRAYEADGLWHCTCDRWGCAVVGGTREHAMVSAGLLLMLSGFEALRDYAEHHQDCPARWSGPDAPVGPCRCRLDEVLALRDAAEGGEAE